MEKKCCGRREFMVNTLHTVTQAGFATLGMISILYAQNSTDTGKSEQKKEVLVIDLNEGNNKKLKEIGSSVYVDNPHNKKRPIIICRVSDNMFTAFSSKCTHKGGPVGTIKNGVCTCKWHKAEFDAYGKVKKGPAKSDLKAFEVLVENDALKIIL